VEHPYGERTEAEDAWSECMATEVKPLQERIKQLEARISELEAACVMGGDGKPIEFGGKTYVRSPYTGKVKELDVDRLVIVSSSRTIVGNDFPYRPSDCYSSPDQVPEEGK